MRKKFISILLSVAMVLSMLLAPGTEAMAAGDSEKTVITNVTATSNVSELPVYGKKRENPEINIIEGSPAEYNTGGTPNWNKKMPDGSWGRYDSEIGANFVEGEYQIQAMFGLYGGNYDNYEFSDDVKLNVDGVEWTRIGEVRKERSYSFFIAVSPIFYVHNWNERLQSDETGHWIGCKECDATKDKEAHLPDRDKPTETEPVLCTKCGYEIQPANVHTHSYTECVVDSKYLSTNATCTEKAKYFKTCSCGAIGTETFEDGDPIGHAPESRLSYDDSQHYYLCKNAGCKAHLDEEEHIFASETDPTCDKCGYVRVIDNSKKTEISKVVATSNVAELPVYGKERENPKINIIEGSPAKYNSGGNPNWYKKMPDGSWERYDSEIGANFEEGEYQIKGAWFGLYEGTYHAYRFADDVKLIVDGVEWTRTGDVRVDGSGANLFSYFMADSPVFYVHNWDEKVQSDETGHWTGCKECDAIKDKKAHVPDREKATTKDSMKCTKCGYVIAHNISSVKLGTTAYTYNGSVKNPTIVVKDAEGKILLKNKDYTVKVPAGRKAVGKYTYKVTFQGNYDGTKTLSFTIKPAKAALKSVTVGKKNVTVKATTKPSSKGGSHYQLAYKQKGAGKWKYTTTSSQRKTIKNLKKGKQYQLKVRAYKKVGKITYYGSWSTTKVSKKVK